MRKAQRILLLSAFLIFKNNCFGQNNVSSLVLNTTFQQYNISKPEKRKFIQLKDKSVIVKINPFTYIGGSLLFIYQNILSEQIQANCRYEISCSNYTKLAIEKYGLIKGAIMGAHQLGNCNNGITNDHEEHAINDKGKVINTEKE